MILERFPKRTLFALLLCFVALVGVVGAYAYILNNQTSVELVKMDVSNGLILEVDKTVYKQEENVTITFTNDSNETVAFPHSGWFAVKDSEGSIVAPYVVTGAVLKVPAEEYLTFVWNQHNMKTSRLVPLGIYVVEVTVYGLVEVEEGGFYLAAIADLSVNFKIVD